MARRRGKVEERKQRDSSGVSDEKLMPREQCACIHIIVLYGYEDKGFLLQDYFLASW